MPECEFIAAVLNEQVFTPLGLRLHFLPETLDIFQEDEASRAAALAQLVPVLADPVARVALGILGYELDDDEMAQLEEIWAKKRAASDAALERLNNPPPPPAQTPPAAPMPEQMPPEPTPPKSIPVESFPTMQLDPAQVKELDLWRQIVLRQFHKGKLPRDVDFECKVLASDLASAVRGKLQTAQDEAAIIESFYVMPRVQDDGMSALAAALQRACDLLDEEAKKATTITPPQQPSNYTINIPPQPPPNFTVNVNPTPVTVQNDVIVPEAPPAVVDMSVNPTPVNIQNDVIVPEAPPAVVDVTVNPTPIVNNVDVIVPETQPPVVNITTPPAEVTVNLPEPKPVDFKVRRDNNGKISGIEET